MVFWIAILAGISFIWLALRLGFYEMWILFFNALISIYVAIFLAPTVARFAPIGGGGASYVMALSMLVLAGVCFAVLQGLSYVFLTGQFSVAFPRFFDVLLSGALGFATGFLVLSFAALIVTTTPLAEQEMVRSIGFSRQSQQANISCLARCCNLIHAIAAPGASGNATETALDRLLEESGASDDDGFHTDANEPADAHGRQPPPHSPAASVVRDRTLDDMEP